MEPSSHWARPASERSGRGRCVGPNAISGFIREADSAHAARGDRSGQSGGINVLRLEYQGHKPAAHAANRLTRPHRHKPSADTATCVDHGCQSPRAFLIWEIWAKADICGPVGAAAEPSGFVGTSARLYPGPPGRNIAPVTRPATARRHPATMESPSRTSGNGRGFRTLTRPARSSDRTEAGQAQATTRARHAQ